MDKVQKIREEVVRMHNLLPVVDGYNIYLNYADRICTTLEMYIDSLQEEPKFKINDKIRYIDGDTRTVVEVREDNYKLDDSSVLHFNTQDQWELVERKPLFKQGDILYKISDGSKIEIIDIVADQYKFECGDEFPHYEFFGYIENNYSKELVNGDFNKEIQHWREHYIKVKESGFQIDLRDIEAVAEHFANWQKNHLWKPADGDDLPDIDREVIALLDNGKVVFAHRPPKYWDGKNIITGKVTRNYPKTYGKGGWNIPNVKWWLDCQIPKMGED